MVLIWIVVAIIVFFLCGWNHKVHTVYYEIRNSKVKKDFRLVHLSDLHGGCYGGNQEQILKLIEKANPNIVCMSGDMFDERRTCEYTMLLMKKLSDKYPCFYVSGNHEYKGNINEMKDCARQSGVHLLEDSHSYVYSCNVNVCGIDDPYLKLKPYEDSLQEAFDEVDESRYTILLAHRPELILEHLQYPCDLVLSGHAHGGQWRIPYLINGLYAPQQGFFPKYAGGMYKHDDKVHIVNRGLALFSLLPRIYNRPEVVVVDIKQK